MKKSHRGKILYNKQISIDTFKMIIKSEIKEIKSGHFISILIPNKTLRRPFSVAGFNNGEITVMYKLKGDGTNYLKNLKENDEVEFLAPLGNLFEFEKINSALLIGAGIGIAPMLFLKDELNRKGIKNYLIAGFKNKEEKIEGSDETIIGGSVLDNIDEIIKKTNPDMIYSCGPHIVLKLVSEIGKKHNIKTQVAMEKVMACGIGVCRGCVIKLNKNGEIVNKTVCKDGPVFMGDEVIWE